MRWWNQARTGVWHSFDEGVFYLRSACGYRITERSSLISRSHPPQESEGERVCRRCLVVTGWARERAAAPGGREGGTGGC